MVNKRLRKQKKNRPVIISVLCNISHPRKCLVPTFLHNLQVANLNPRYCEVRNFEFNRYGCAFLEILFYNIDENSLDRITKKEKEVELSTAFNTGQSKVCTHEEFTTTSQLFYLPHESRLVWSILHTPRRCLVNIILKTKLHKQKTIKLTRNLGLSASSGTGA